MDLKHCPFCGGKAEIESKGSARQSMIVRCTYCGAQVECGSVYGLTPSKDYGWNQRVPAPALGGMMAGADYRYCDNCDRKAFYDANLSYEWETHDERALVPDGAGAWIVLCVECAKTHKLVIQPKD